MTRGWSKYYQKQVTWDRLINWSGYWSKKHFNNCLWIPFPACQTDYDALLRQFMEVLIVLVLARDTFIPEDCLMTWFYLQACAQTHISYKLIPIHLNSYSPWISPINRENWQVINETLDQVYLYAFPGTSDSGILVRFPVVGQLSEHADGWDN